MTREEEEPSMAETLEVADLMARYAAALDRRDLAAWAGLFADEASYTVASAENEAANLPLLHINDDSRSKIDDRIRFIEGIWEGSFNDYIQRHILSLPVVSRRPDGRSAVELSFSVYATETDFGSARAGRSALLCVGNYHIETVGQKSARRLSALKVVLDTSALAQSLVYPV